MTPDCQLNVCDVASLEEFPGGLRRVAVNSTLAVAAEDAGLISSTHVAAHTYICNSSSRESNAVFCPPHAPGLYVEQRRTDRQNTNTKIKQCTKNFLLMDLIALKYLKLHFSAFFFSFISLSEVYFGEMSRFNLDRKITI